MYAPIPASPESFSVRNTNGANLVSLSVFFDLFYPPVAPAIQVVTQINDMKRYFLRVDLELKAIVRI